MKRNRRILVKTGKIGRPLFLKEGSYALKARSRFEIFRCDPPRHLPESAQVPLRDGISGWIGARRQERRESSPPFSARVRRHESARFSQGAVQHGREGDARTSGGDLQQLLRVWNRQGRSGKECAKICDLAV